MRLGRRRRKGGGSSSAHIPPRDDGDVNGLRVWALSLPFVNERVGRDDTVSVREFVIDCSLLQVDRPWLLIHDGERQRTVIALITHGDGDVSCIGLNEDGAVYDPLNVEKALLLAYQSAFVSCG